MEGLLSIRERQRAFGHACTGFGLDIYSSGKKLRSAMAFIYVYIYMYKPGSSPPIQLPHSTGATQMRATERGALSTLYKACYTYHSRCDVLSLDDDSWKLLLLQAVQLARPLTNPTNAAPLHKPGMHGVAALLASFLPSLQVRATYVAARILAKFVGPEQLQQNPCMHLLQRPVIIESCARMHHSIEDNRFRHYRYEQASYKQAP